MKDKRVNEIIKVAQKARELLGIKGNDPINDITKLITETTNIKIIGQNFPEKYKDLEAFVYIENKKYTIGVNPYFGKSQYRLRFTLAHELGHIFLNHLSEDGNFLLFRENKISFDSNQKLEKDANIFAANFLAPEEGVKKLISSPKVEGDEEKEIKEVVDYYKISDTAAKYRIKSINK